MAKSLKDLVKKKPADQPVEAPPAAGATSSPVDGAAPAPPPAESPAPETELPAGTDGDDTLPAGLVELPGETDVGPTETNTGPTEASVTETNAGATETNVAPTRFRVSLPGQPSAVVVAEDEDHARAAYDLVHGVIATDHRHHVEPWHRD